MNTSFFKEMFSFAGWNLFGSSCMVIKSQGLPIVLNLFFGVIVNAAIGIANQINFQLITFSNFMLKAIGPQIAKSEGGGNRQRMLKLSLFACKVSFVLLALFAIPLIIEMEYVLKVWLKDFPEYTAIFSILILVSSLIQQLTVGLMRAIQSTGKIKGYQSITGSVLLLNIPVAFVVLKMGFDPESVLIASICIELIAVVIRIYFTEKLTGLRASVFLKEVILTSIITAIITSGFGLLPLLFMSEGFLRLVVVVLSSSLALLVTTRFLVLNKEEEERVVGIFKEVFDKIRRK
jgi:O-antigen/teichoic acid export membrane protein